MSDEVRNAVEELILKSCEEATQLLDQKPETAIEIIRSVASLMVAAKQ